MKTYFTYYKARKGIESIQFFRNLCCPKEEIRSNKSFDVFSNDVFTEVTQFLDIQSIATFSCVSKVVNRKTQYQPVWKQHYDSTWKAMLASSGTKEVMLNNNYKSLCIESFMEFKSKNQ